MSLPRSIFVSSQIKVKIDILNLSLGHPIYEPAAEIRWSKPLSVL